MKALSLERMEEIQGGVRSSCVAALAGALGLFAWSLSVPLTGGVSLAFGLTGASIMGGTVASILDCRGYY